MPRYLIVNADDFGRSSGVNLGIIRAHESGIVTSASMMVRWPAAADAAAYCRRRPELSAGLHVDLGEWSYRENRWLPLYSVVPAQDVESVSEEITRQIDAFRFLVGRDPTHIDSHQHAHREEPVRSILLDQATRLSIPLREFTPRIRYCGDFYGQGKHGTPCREAITVDALVALLSRLQPGITELSCHPAIGKDLDTMYGLEREQETGVLCDPRVFGALGREKIVLRSFSNLTEILRDPREIL